MLKLPRSLSSPRAGRRADSARIALRFPAPHVRAYGPFTTSMALGSRCVSGESIRAGPAGKSRGPVQVRSDLGLAEPAHDRIQAEWAAPHGVHAVEMPEELPGVLRVRLAHLAFREFRAGLQGPV